MITGITIKNFRGLRDVSVDGFSRVNIVVGDNGSGKTSLIEAIYLAMSSSAQIALQLRWFRLGFVGSAVSNILGDLLSEGADEFSVKARGGDRVTRDLTAWYDLTQGTLLRSLTPVAPGEARLSASAAGFRGSNVLTPADVFRWQDHGGHFVHSIFQGGSPPLSKDEGDLAAVGTTFLPSYPSGQSRLANLYSDLDKAGRADELFTELHRQFPGLEVIAIQMDEDRPHLHARFHGQRRQRPLEFLSGGLTRLSTFLLEMTARQVDILVIDEIENGLHHTRFPLLWKQIRDFAVRFDKQVFATTHSQECLDAAADAMAEAPEDFALVRTAQTPAGCKVGIVSGEPVQLLLRSGLEVSG